MEAELMINFRVMICVFGLIIGMINPCAPVQAYSVMPLPIDELKMEQAGFMTAEIPQIAGGMESKMLVKHNEALRKRVMDQYRTFEEAALATKALATYPESMKKHLVFKAGYKVSRNEGRILSLTQNIYVFTGGAHGMYWKLAYNLDVQTGDTLKLPEVFVPGSNWSERFDQRVREQKGLFPDHFKGVGPKSHFYFDEKGLNVFFQLYEIAPYAAGIIQVEFSYEELRDILKPEYSI